jgi:hypothetical protein
MKPHKAEKDCYLGIILTQMPNGREEISKRKWKKEDFLCLSLSSTKLPFLWRTHQVRKMLSPIPPITVKKAPKVPAKKKGRASAKRRVKKESNLKANTKREAHIHFLFERFGSPNLYSYIRTSDCGFPCPFCCCKTVRFNVTCILLFNPTCLMIFVLTDSFGKLSFFGTPLIVQYTENGLWTHLMTSKGAHLQLVPNLDMHGFVRVSNKLVYPLLYHVMTRSHVLTLFPVVLSYILLSKRATPGQKYKYRPHHPIL